MKVGDLVTHLWRDHGSVGIIVDIDSRRGNSKLLYYVYWTKGKYSWLAISEFKRVVG